VKMQLKLTCRTLDFSNLESTPCMSVPVSLPQENDIRGCYDQAVVTKR
jgi:hypothetical protein